MLSGAFPAGSSFFPVGAVKPAEQKIKSHENFRVHHLSLSCLVHQPVVHQKKRNPVYGNILIVHPSSFRYLPKSVRQIKGYHFRRQSGGGRPGKQIGPGGSAVSGFLFQLPARGFQGAFLSAVPGKPGRQPDGKRMQGKTVLLHQQQFSLFRHRNHHDGSVGVYPAYIFPSALLDQFQKFATEKGLRPFFRIIRMFHHGATLDFRPALVNHVAVPLP